MGKELTYREVEELKKKADVYELNPNARYLFVFNKAEVSRELVSRFVEGFPRWGINGRVLGVYGQNALKIFELEHS